MIIRPSHAIFALSGWVGNAANSQMDASGLFGAIMIGAVGLWASWWETSHE